MLTLNKSNQKANKIKHVWCWTQNTHTTEKKNVPWIMMPQCKNNAFEQQPEGREDWLKHSIRCRKSNAALRHNHHQVLTKNQSHKWNSSKKATDCWQWRPKKKETVRWCVLQRQITILPKVKTFKTNHLVTLTPQWSIMEQCWHTDVPQRCGAWWDLVEPKLPPPPPNHNYKVSTR